MKERPFAGMLNSKRYGQSWGDSLYFRLCKYDSVYEAWSSECPGVPTYADYWIMEEMEVTE